MHQALWARQPPPSTPADAVPWDWDISTPVDLTVSRGRLREDLLSGARPVGSGTDDVDRLLLAFEELTSNGLRHGGSPVRVRVTPTPGGWLIDVTDSALDSPPTPAVDRDPADGGLGLYLVARLCAAHGWSVQHGRKHVWACIEPAWPPRT